MAQLVFFVLANLAGSFLTALCETSLLASSEARIRARIASGDERAAQLLKLLQDPGRTIASIVLLNNVFAIGGTATIAAIATTIVPGGTTGMAIFIVIQTLLVIAFAEITPKLLGEARPETFAVRFAPSLVWVRRILLPAVWFVERLVAWARPKGRVASGAEEEIRELARLGQRAGHIEPEEADLILRIFRFDDITAQDVMTPRPLAMAFRADTALADIRAELLGARHNQYPVYEEDLDRVTGVLTLRDALVALASNEGQLTVADLQRPPLFLPTSRAVGDVLRDLQPKHGGLAIVIDEYGVTEGIISMDDVVEELLGEAIDEADLREGLVKRLSRTTALVHGLTRVRDIARFLNCTVTFQNLAEQNTTVTGLLQERLDRIPVAGDRIAVAGGLSLDVQEADDRIALRVMASASSQVGPRR